MSKQNKTILSCLKKVLGVDEGKTIENVLDRFGSNSSLSFVAVVNLRSGFSMNSYKADKTIDEILEMLDKGTLVVLKFNQAIRSGGLVQYYKNTMWILTDYGTNLDGSISYATAYRSYISNNEKRIDKLSYGLSDGEWTSNSY